MSTPILPFAMWESGTTQNSIPANDNSLRNQILNGLVIADDVDTQPASPADGDIYIIPDGATGDQWSLFDPGDLVIFESGTWYAYAPVAGVSVNLAGQLTSWDGSEWVANGGLSDAPSDGSTYGRKDGAWTVVGGGGSGDVAGPASAVDERLAVFDGTTGKLIKDGGKTIAEVIADAGGVQSVVAGAGVTVDATDPANPIVSALGGSDVVPVNTPANSSGTVTLDFASKSKYVGTITLAANVTTLAFSNLPVAGSYAEYELHIKQDGTGSRTFAIPASHKNLGGSDTSIASAANVVTVLSASTVDGGTTWRYAMQESA